MNELEDVIYRALRGAARDLPGHSFGFRTHALPTESQLDSCVRACGRLIASSGGHPAEVFIGSSQPAGAPVEGVRVFSPETAAEEATARRNRPNSRGESPTLIYLNARSTAGESGLEVLEDLSAADLARGFAAEAGLPILKQIAESRSRLVIARLEDASVELLALYEKVVRSCSSEAFALPLLGLLPLAKTKRLPPGAVAADEFDKLKGARAENKLKLARDRLKSLSVEQRNQLAPRLQPYLLDSHPDPAAAVVKLCDELHQLASGRSQPSELICGVTVELARLLRNGEDGIDALLGPDAPDDVDESTAPAAGEARSTWELLEESGPPGLDGQISTEEAEEAEISDASLPTFMLQATAGTISLKAESAPGLLLAVLDAPDLATYVDLGCAALVTVKFGASKDVFTARTRSAAVINWRDRLDVAVVDELSIGQAEVGRFREARRRLCDALLAEVAPSEPAALDSSGEAGEAADERDLRRLLSLLDEHSLVVARRWPNESQAYVDAYEELLKVAQTSAPGGTEHPLGVWLANLDVAFSTEANRVTAARLLPLHPLRLASALRALTCGGPPPPFPARLAVNFQRTEWLEPSGTPDVYGFVSGLLPSTLGVAAAAREGLAATWHLVRPTGLVTALRIAFVDVDSNAIIDAIDEVCAAARSLFEKDSGVLDGVHLEVWRTTTAGDGSVGAEPSVGPLGPTATECEAISRGEGVSLEFFRAIVGAESVPYCHLVVRAVETPYEAIAPMPQGSPLLALKYQPGTTGNIAYVEVADEPALEQYDRLLEAWGLNPKRRGPNPVYPGGGPPRALVDARVALRGWPVEPHKATDLLSYLEFRGHIIAVLGDASVADPALARRLREISSGMAPDIAALRRAALGLFSSRAFLQRLLETGYDDRHLLGQLGLLRAFAEIVGDTTPTLPLSLDSPEGRAWITSVLPAGAPKRRADLLLLEAPGSHAPQDVWKLRVVELKARSAPSAEAGWPALAAQALQTLASVQRCFGTEADPVHRAALQRLAWMEAGRQHLAGKWEAALRALEARMAEGPAPKLSVECWVILNEPWRGETDFERACDALDDTGQPADGEAPVNVRFRVLAPPDVAPLPVPPPPSAPAAPGGRARPVEPLRPTPTSSSGAAVPADPGRTESISPDVPAAPPVSDVPSAASQTAQSADGMRLNLGVSARDGRPVVWMPNRTDLVNHFNVGITGTMGTGKTQLTKSLLAQLVWEGRHNPGGRGPGLLVFDYKGDYQDSATEPFASRVGATVLQPEGLPLNPLRTIRPTSRQEFVALARTFADTMLAIQPRIGAVQRMELVTAVTECFEAAGLSASDPSSWDRPFPTLRDLHAHLVSQGRGQGTPQAVLMDMVDMGIFADQDPAGELDGFFDGVHVINLKPLGSMPTLIRAVLCFFMNAFYGRMLRAGEAALVQPGGSTHHLRALRRLVLVDEADDFMSLGLHSLKNVMQQGRSFGCGVVLSTQFLHHFNRGEDPLRPLIGTWLLHQMSDLNPPDVRSLFGVSKAEGDQLVARLSSLPKHTSLCIGLSSAGGPMRPGIPLELRDLPFKDLRGPEGQGG